MAFGVSLGLCDRALSFEVMKSDAPGIPEALSWEKGGVQPTQCKVTKHY